MSPGEVSSICVVHADEICSEFLDRETLGVRWGKIPMDSVGAIRHDHVMEILANVGAMVAGVVTVLAGIFSLATILFDDII